VRAAMGERRWEGSGEGAEGLVRHLRLGSQLRSFVEEAVDALSRSRCGGGWGWSTVVVVGARLTVVVDRLGRRWAGRGTGSVLWGGGSAAGFAGLVTNKTTLPRRTVRLVPNRRCRGEGCVRDSVAQSGDFSSFRRVSSWSGIGDRGSGVPGSGFRGPGSGVRGLGSAVRGAGCGVRGLSVFSYRGSPLPSSLFPLPSSDFRLPSRDWSLVTGRWSVGVGQWTFNGPILAYRFRLSTCRSRRAMYDFQC
jgi:hypothetical protein